MRLLRGPLLALAAFLPGAAGPPPLDIQVHAGPDGIAIVEVDNRSGDDLCTYQDVANANFSPNLALRIRRVGGAPLEGVNPGWLPPPAEGLHISTGHSVLGRQRITWLYPDFPRLHRKGRWEMQASFRFHHCGQDDWQEVASAWTPL